MAENSENPLIPGALIASQDTQLAVAARAANIQPKQPESISGDKLTAIQQSASRMVALHLENPTSLSVVTTVRQIGLQNSLEATRQSHLLEAKVRPLMVAAKEVKGPIPEGLLKLRKESDKINPVKLMATLDQGWIGWALSLVSDPMKQALQNVALNYETAEKSIEGIVNGLLSARGGLEADNVELAQMVEDIKPYLEQLSADAYESELALVQINQAPMPSGQIAQAVRGALVQQLLNKIEDLRTMETAVTFLVLITMKIYEGNCELSDVLNRSATITRTILTVGFANMVALIKQKKTIEFVKDARKFNEDMLQSLAKAVGMGAQEIAKLMSAPALRFEAMKKAYGDLTAQLNKADQIGKERNIKALQNLPQMAAMRDDLNTRIKRLETSLQEAAQLPASTD